MAAGQAILAAVQAKFFGGFRVSVMLDSNGGNTTAAAAVAKLAKSGAISGKKAVVLAGTGPVGQRAAAMLALEGAAQVVITSRVLAHAQHACDAMKERFGVDLIAAEAADAQARAWVLKDAQILLSTGAAGIELLPEEYWRDHPTLELVADANATPPLGVGGLALADRGAVRHGKTVWGALGFGPFKLALQRACVARLFEQNDLVFDAEEIFAAAKAMA
jgi:threonine dehydrogenase-like Zn-dependent dehydrogenase